MVWDSCVDVACTACVDKRSRDGDQVGRGKTLAGEPGYLGGTGERCFGRWEMLAMLAIELLCRGGGRTGMKSKRPASQRASDPGTATGRVEVGGRVGSNSFGRWQAGKERRLAAGRPDAQRVVG